MSPYRAIRSTVIPTLLFLGIVTAGVIQALRRPLYNFDVIGYTASALELEGATGDDLLTGTREAIDSGVRDERMRYWLLKGTSEYGTRVITEARCLEQQLGYYRPRVLYVAGMALCHRLGANLVDATSWLSAPAWGLLALVVWCFARARVGAWPATILALSSMWGLGWDWHARLATADGLSTLFGVSGSLLLLRATLATRELCAAAVLLGLGVASRHDSILHVVLFGPPVIWAMAAGAGLKAKLVRMVIVLLPPMLAYLWIAATTGWLGWNVVLVCGLVGAPLYPLDAPPEFPFEAYRASCQEMLRALVRSPFALRESWPLWSLVSGWRWVAAPERVVLLVCVLEVVARFALFPRLGSGWHRLSMTPITIALFVCATAVVSRLMTAYWARRDTLPDS